MIKGDAAPSLCDEGAYADVAASRPSEEPSVADTWRLVRTPNPAGGRDAVSVMHTADVFRSDLDFAGLMLRCGDNTIEALLVLVRPFPRRAHPTVTVGVGPTRTEFTASVVPPGALVLLPPRAAALAAGPWQAMPELTIRIEDGEGPIRGVVPLTGLRRALHLLRSNCPTQ
jgi:hypothetical protein